MASYMEYYNYLMTKGDPRTNNWFLVGSPGPLLTILATYLYFCNSAGPKWMKDRKPFELKGLMNLYNTIQVLFNFYMVYEGLFAGWLFEYSFACQPVDYSDSPSAKRMATGVWLYYICKLTELLDTVFFILRKKNNQVTYLHIYHHTLMPVCAWIGVKYLPGGHGTLMGVINAFIHVVMYSYYLVSSWGPQYQKYLWWKKYLTILQMVQFCIISVHNGQVLFRSCDYPKVINLLLCTQAIYFLYLFGTFYYRTYINPIRSKTKETNASTNGKIKSQ